MNSTVDMINISYFKDRIFNWMSSEVIRARVALRVIPPWALHEVVAELNPSSLAPWVTQ